MNNRDTSSNKRSAFNMDQKQSESGIGSSAPNTGNLTDKNSKDPAERNKSDAPSAIGGADRQQDSSVGGRSPEMSGERR